MPPQGPGRDKDGNPNTIDAWYRSGALLNPKGSRLFDRFVPGFWDAILGPNSDWFDLKQEPGRKKVCRGWEKHADDIRWEPGPYNPPAPKWHNTMIKGPYKGRKSYLNELDWENPILERGRSVDMMGQIREWDEMWWDPPVPKGTAFEGLDGVDTSYTPSVHEKGDRAMPVEAWTKYVRDASEQGRQIAAKFQLSPQHPGLRINPAQDGAGACGKHSEEVGLAVEHAIDSDYRTIYSPWRMWPRFWDSPLHQDPLVKAAFGAKAGLFVGTGACALEVGLRPNELLAPYGLKQPWNWPGHSIVNARAWAAAIRNIMPRYVALPTTYCGLLSMTASIRGGRDDVLNHVPSCLAMGSMVAVIKNGSLSRGYMVSVLCFGAAYWYQQSRYYQYGWTGPTPKVKWNFGHAVDIGTGKETILSQAPVPFRPALDTPTVPNCPST